MKEDPRKLGAARVPTRGAELLGGVLFLVGSLPAVALLKAYKDGTDLVSEGLGGTALLAARISAWVGLWPGLLISAAIAVLGTMAVLGALRTDLLRRAVGIAVCGLGVAAISSALAEGTGGRIGDGTGAQLSAAVGAWAGILAGLGVVAVALWLAFAEPPRTGSRTLEVSLDGPDLRRPRPTRVEPEARPVTEELKREERPTRKRAPRKEPKRQPVADGGEEVESAPSFPASERAEPQPEPQPEPDEPVEARQQPSASQAAPSEAASSDPAPAPAPAPSAAESRPTPPPLTREPEPVIDGPSAPARAGRGPMEGLWSWFTGVAGSAASMLSRRRPRVAMPAPRRSEPQTLGDALVQGEVEGVSHDEAAALAPDEDTLAYMEEVWRKAAAGFEQEAPVPPSPYPDDPRMKGEIPPGTRPLGAPAEARQRADSASAPAGSAPAVEPDLDVAPFDLIDDLSDVSEETASEETGAAGTDAGAASETDLPEGVSPLAGPAPADGARVEAIAPGDVELTRPPASWEVGYESEAEADGQWRRARLGEPEPVVEPAPEESPAEESPAEETPAEAELEPEPEAADESDAAEELEVSAEEAEEPDAAVEYEEEYEEDLEEEEPAAEAEDAEEEDAEEEVEYEYVDEDGNPIDLEDLEDGEYEVVDEEDYEEVAEYEEVEEDEDPDAEDEEEEDPEAELEDSEEEYEEYEEAAEDEAAPEPQAPLPSGEDTRLLDAGRVLVRQGRVAVSVLQQELDMEFDEACELLDRLQAEGLIGPYKGGKKRDILLTEEEWEDRFARS